MSRITLDQVNREEVSMLFGEMPRERTGRRRRTRTKLARANDGMTTQSLPRARYVGVSTLTRRRKQSKLSDRLRASVRMNHGTYGSEPYSAKEQVYHGQ